MSVCLSYEPTQQQFQLIIFGASSRWRLSIILEQILARGRLIQLLKYSQTALIFIFSTYLHTIKTVKYSMKYTVPILYYVYKNIKYIQQNIDENKNLKIPEIVVIVPIIFIPQSC